MTREKQLATTVALCVIALCLLLSAGTLTAQDAPMSAPTLVPPTLVPVAESGMIDALPSESAVAAIQREGKVRIGLLYNEPPFGELNTRGEVSGFDADLARAIAEAWAVEAELVQVTRQTALDMLKAGSVDMLIAAQVHRRDLDGEVEFSQTYYPNTQMMMVREGDGATVLGHMDTRKVGVVIGSRGEQAVSEWLTRTGLNVNVVQYLTLDLALSALLAQEVDGVVESRVKLARAFPEAGVTRFVEEPVSAEPYAVVMRRQDIHMRNLVNRTLQYLVSTDRMNEIHQANFADAPYPADDFTIWNGVGEEAPTPSQFGTDIPTPTQYTVPRIQAEGVVRVAGIADLPDDADASAQRFDAFHRALVEAMAGRWGVRVEYVDSTPETALDLVATGQADLAVGIVPDWAWADRVDFTDHYLQHGRRLLVPANSDVQGFIDLRSDVVGIFASDANAEEEVQALADENRARLDVFVITQDDEAVYGMLVNDNYHAVYGDSLKLMALLEANPDDVKIITGESSWYTRSYQAFAVPRNDIDYRLLVDYTLQELARDGTLQSLLQQVMLPEDIPTFDIWPGSSTYLGYALGG